MAVAGAFALAAAFCALYALLATVLDDPWAAAVTALTFAAVFGVFALTHKPGGGKRHADGDHSGPLAGAKDAAAHLPAQLAHLPAVVTAMARRHPAAAVGIGAVAALVVLRRPALMLLAASHLLGVRRKRSPWERARDLLPF